MGSVDSRRCGRQNWNVRDKKLQNEVLKYEIGGVLDEVGLETSFQRRRKFGRERPKNRRKIRDHVARGGAYTPYFELDLFGAVVAGARFSTFLEYVVPNSMERVAAAAEVQYVLPTGVGGVGALTTFAFIMGDFGKNPGISLRWMLDYK